MIPIYKDLITGQIATERWPNLTLWDLTESNWSCDCNRCLSFPPEIEEELSKTVGKHICFGNQRIIVIDLLEEGGDFNGSTKEDLIAEMNREYMI